MSLALLFWFYKEPAICQNRLDLLGRHHSGVPTYGLFGGEREQAHDYQARLGSRLDDFYTAPFEDSHWKWINGDLVLQDWYESRGHRLAWDHVAVVQWDMLVFDSILNQVRGIKDGEICLSGMGLLDPAQENSWFWTRPGERVRDDFLNFKRHIRDVHQYTGDLFHCGFILQVFPRIFFEKYATVKNKEIGMLEYKIPTYAKMFGLPIYEKDWGVGTAMTANSQPIADEYIRGELRKPDGRRLFHPYYRIWDAETST